MGRLTLGLTLAVYTAIGAGLTPAWSSNVALWERVRQVSPTHARGILNLGDAVNKAGDPERAMRLWWEARDLALHLKTLPNAEARLLVSAADQNLATYYLTRGNHVKVGQLLQEAYAVWPEGFASKTADDQEVPAP